MELLKSFLPNRFLVFLKLTNGICWAINFIQLHLVPTTNMSVHTHSLSLALLFIYTLLSLTNYLQPIFGDYCLSTPYIHLYSQVLLCSRCCRQVRQSQNHTSQRLVMQALNYAIMQLEWMQVTMDDSSLFVVFNYCWPSLFHALCRPGQRCVLGPIGLFVLGYS